MNVTQLPDGRLRVPARAEDPETGTVGDGLVTIGPEHPDYAKYIAWLKRQQKQRTRENQFRQR